MKKSNGMKKFAPIVLTVAMTTALLIGCDFIDGNTSYVDPDQPTNVEARSNGYFTTAVDTTGNEDPGDMDPPSPNP